MFFGRRYFNHQISATPTKPRALDGRHPVTPPIDCRFIFWMQFFIQVDTNIFAFIRLFDLVPIIWFVRVPKLDPDTTNVEIEDG